MKKLLVLIACIALCHGAKSQTYGCRTSSTSTVIPNFPTAYNCNNISSFYPSGNDVVKIYANFIFTKPSTGIGKWDNITASDCQRVLDSMNLYLANLKPATFPLPAPYTAGFFNDAKIRFVLKTVSHPINDSVYLHSPVYDTLNTDAQAMNFIYGNSTDTSHCGYGEGDPFNNQLFMVACAHNTTPETGTDISGRGAAHLMIHELGHCFGLFHTDEIKPNLLYLSSNSAGTVLPQYFINDFWLEDPTQFGQNLPVMPNNLMGYTWPMRDYLSPKQLGYIHHILRTHSIIKQTVQSYSTSPANCYGNGNIYTIPANTSATWSVSQSLQGDVILESGAHLTISTCISMPKEGKIIVKQGAKLSVINGQLTGRPCGQWAGIEVWGTGGPQTINTSGMPDYNGMVYFENAVISNAETGVRLTQTDGSGNPVYGTSGGIILSQKTKYINNKIAVDFYPLYYLSPGGCDNAGTFKLDTFIVDEAYYSPTPPVAALRLKNVYAVHILGCYFKDVALGTSTGIKCISASVKLQDHCSVVFGTICAGTLTQNKFMGFEHCIYVSDLIPNAPNRPCSIDHVAFDQRDVFTDLNGTNNNTRGCVYMVNSVGAQITNCSFKTAYHYPASSSPIVYGLYLDDCSGYVVQENTFSGLNNGTYKRSAGIIINNSGPDANSVYNNTFSSEFEGVWAQNENYDPVTGHGGLVINCNTFTGSNGYNIGVQSWFQGGSCPSCPAPTQNAGIATTQGIPSVTTPSLNVRNNYSAYCSTGGENQLYVDTQNPFAISSHGSFYGAQYHPVPQPNCSNPAEVVILASTFVIVPQSVYCPSFYYQQFSMRGLNDLAGDLRNRISILKAQHAALDGGNTHDLIDAIHNTGYTPTEIKDLVLAPDFLSDTVLKAFFSLSTMPHNYLLEVFTKNAPVHPFVWQTVAAIDLKDEEPAIWDSIQFQNKLSSRAALESNLSVAHNELGLVTHEKIRRFSNDSLRPLYDSIIDVYDRNEVANSRHKKADALIAYGKFEDAVILLDSLETDSLNSHFCRLSHYVMRLYSDSTYLDTLRADSAVYSYLQMIAASNNALVEGRGKALLQYVYDYTYNEIRLEPAESGGSTERKISPTAKPPVKKGEAELAKGIRLYPNPATNRLTLEMETGTPEAELQISDLSGNILLKQHCKETCTIDISALQNGLFLIYLYKQATCIAVKKLVVIK